MSAPPSLSNARYTIPDWFLKYNVKTPADLSAAPDQIALCNCDECKEAKADDDVSEADIADEERPDEAGADVRKDGAERVSGGWTSLLARELCTDEIHYKTFVNLRDMTAAALVADRDGNLLRPEASAVVLRMEREELSTVTDYDDNYNSYERTETTMASCMEPVWMGRAVELVAKTLGVPLVALDLQDLEELGCEFHRQDKEAQKYKTSADGAIPLTTALETPEESADEKRAGSTENAKSTEGRGNKDGETQEAEEAHEAEEAQEAEDSQEAEDFEDNNAPDSSNQQQWEPDVCSLSAFLDHFFAARAERYAATESWQRTQLVWALVLDAIKEKLAIESTTSEIPGGISRTSAVIFHITDYRDVDFRLKKRALKRFAGMLRQRRKHGDAVVMIVSTKDGSMEPGNTLHRKVRATKASTIVGCNAKKLSDADLATREQTYNGAINARVLRYCLRECCGHLLPMDLLKATADWASAERGNSFKAFGGTLWTSEDMSNIVTQIMGRAWLKPELRFADIRAVLKRLGCYTLIEPGAPGAESQGGPANSERAESEDTKDESKAGNTSEEPNDNTTPEDTTDNITPEDTTDNTSPENTAGNTYENTAPEGEDGDILSGLDLNDFEQELTKCIVDPTTLKTGWDDVIINQETKELVQQFVASHRLRIDCTSEPLRRALRIRGALLYGPPGTGKTALSRAVATASESRMLAVSSASLISKWDGEPERYIQAAFTLANKLHPCVLFIDEVDSLFYRRFSGDPNYKRAQTNQFLQEMDDILQNDKAPLVLAATNRPWDLDEAFMRRLQHKIYVGLPDIEARVRILRLYLHQDDLNPNVDIDGLAQMTEGYSGSDLKTLCAKAGLLWEAEQARLYTPYKSVFDKSETTNEAPRKVELGIDHFVKALDKIRPSSCEELAEDLERFSTTHNPTASSTKWYTRFLAQALISKPAPKQQDWEDEMQLQSWCQLDLHIHLVHCLHTRLAVLLFYSQRVLEHQMQVQAWRQIDLRRHLMHRLYTNLTVLLLFLHTHDHSIASLRQTALEAETSTAAGSERKVRQKSQKAARKKSKLKKSFSHALGSEDSTAAEPNFKVRQKNQKAAKRNKSKVTDNVSAALDSEDSTAVGSDSTVLQTTQKTTPRDKFKLDESALATETASFRYTTLGKDEFRVLEIEAGERDAPLVCTLKHISFQSPEFYCALSYTWGSPETPMCIKCNGSDMRITRSLHEALCQMRRTWYHILIWADAICINQSDNLEKSQQVVRMRDIYSKAGRLFVWLGNPVTASDADVAVDTVEKFAQIVASLKLESEKELKDKTSFGIVWQERIQTESISEKEWQKLQDFFLKPWFSRVWIFQEVASVMAFSSENIRVGYGNRVVGWEAVFSVMKIPELFKAFHPASARWPFVNTMRDQLSMESNRRKVKFHLPADEITEEDVATALASNYRPGFRPLCGHERQGLLFGEVAIIVDLWKIFFPDVSLDEYKSSEVDKALLSEAFLTMYSKELQEIGQERLKEVNNVLVYGITESALGAFYTCSTDDEWWLLGSPAMLKVWRLVGFLAECCVKHLIGAAVITTGFKMPTFSYMPTLLFKMWPRMQLARRLEATDLRDKLFAFLGLLDDDVADEPLLQIDYNLSVAEVYVNLTVFFLQRLMCLDVFEHINDMPTKTPRLPNLPSWAIDLSSASDLELFDVGSFNAGGAVDIGKGTFPMHVLQVRVSKDRRRLDLDAYLVGELTELGLLPHHYKQNDHLADDTDHDDLEDLKAAASRTYGLALNMINRLGQPTRTSDNVHDIENPVANDPPTAAILNGQSHLYLTGQSMDEAFSHCLLCDHWLYHSRWGPLTHQSIDGPRMFLKERKVQIVQAWRDFHTMMANGSTPVDLQPSDGDGDGTSGGFGSPPDSATPSPSFDAQLFFKEFEPLARTRVFGVVAHELIGWFPRRAQKGDMLAILPGARCPYVLRRVRRDASMDRNNDTDEDGASQGQEQRSEWEVIGHAYVQGLMSHMVTRWVVGLTDYAKELLGQLNVSGEPPALERICLV